jgi:rhomboid-like protein
MFLHIFLNMFVLNSFGPILETILGWKAFLTLYLVSGIFASISHILVSTFLLGAPDLPVLGASGAISALILVFSLMFPREKILLFGIVPMPALGGALLFIGLDIWGLVAQAEGGGLPIGHGAHLGGALAGTVFFYFWVKPRIRSRWSH